MSALASDVGLYVRSDALSWMYGDPDFVGRIGTWVIAGAGVEMLWFDSEAVYRPKAALGFGGGVEVLGRTKSLGFSFDVRLEFTPIVRWADGMAGRCAGPCEMSFSKLDYNLIGVFTLPFGFGV
jgi:hypothetical protein